MYAVVFDVDGVLVDSYQAHFQSWLAVTGQHGVTMTESDFAATFGRTSRDIILELWGNAELSGQELTAIDDEKEAAFRDIIAANFPVMPGAVELIDALHAAGFALAVGSSGPPENVDLALDKLDRRKSIAAAVTGMDVSRGKPDPQVFQIAAERLEIAPARCAVVEDAAAGVAAANAAGMFSIALVSTGHSADEYGAANRIIQSLDELTPDTVRAMIDEG